MEFDDVFADLENRFEALLNRENQLNDARIMDVRLVQQRPRELGGAAGRIRLIAPQMGSDFIAGIEPGIGTWWSIRLELVHSLRLTVGDSPETQTPTLNRSSTTLAQLAGDWFTPINVRLFVRGEEHGVDARVTGATGSMLSVGFGEQAIQFPIANLMAIRAKFAELTANCA